jgi:hypothetical protein
MPRGSLMILGLVRICSIQLRDDRVRRLVTWYIGDLQKAMDLIWDIIEWGYSFPKIVRKGRGLTLIMSLKIHIPMMPRDKGV